MLRLVLYLEGSTNLNTVPEGDMALGYDVAKKYSSPENQKNFTALHSHTEGWRHRQWGSNRTCFILSKGDDVLVVVIDESRKGAGDGVAHTDPPLPPSSRVFIFLQCHDSPETGSELYFKHKILIAFW